MNDTLLLTYVLIVRCLWVVWYQSIKYYFYYRVGNQDSMTEMCQHEYLQCGPIPYCSRPVHIYFSHSNHAINVSLACCKLKDSIFYPPVPVFQVAALEEVSSLKFCMNFSVPHLSYTSLPKYSQINHPDNTFNNPILLYNCYPKRFLTRLILHWGN